jgi:hypothetical protein
LLDLLLKVVFMLAQIIPNFFLFFYAIQWEKREPDDPGKYLLAIWTPGGTKKKLIFFLSINKLTTMPLLDMNLVRLGCKVSVNII